MNKHFQALIVFSSCFAAMTFMFAVTCASAAEATESNILLITADTTRLDDLACYGGITFTPALESLAADGILFHNAHSVAFGTTPSHASLFTSSHPKQHGVYNNKTIFTLTSIPLAEVLQSNGFSTAAFVSARPVKRQLGFARGFSLFDDDFTSHHRRANETVQRLLDWLGKSREERFFAWIHLFDPHQPYDPPPGYVDRYLPESPSATALNLDFSKNIAVREILDNNPESLPTIDEIARARYRGEIEFMDSQIARITAALKEDGIYEKTMVVFIADHGENFIDPEPELSFNHAGLHRHVTNLPFIMKFPKSLKLRGESHFLVGNIDVGPTLLELLGIQIPDAWSGQSILQTLTSKSDGFRDHLVLEGAHKHEISVRTTEWVYRELTPLARSKRQVRYLNYPAGQHIRLYNVNNDPAETRSVHQSTRPTIVDAIAMSQALIAEFMASGESQKGKEIVDPEHLEALKALGYVEGRE